MAMHTIINTSRIAAVLLLLSFATHNLYAQEPDSVLVAQGTVSVSGTIMDASTGAPLEGINVSIPGHSSAITNQDGAFTIAAPGSTATLMLSGPGYQVKEVAIKGRTEIQISLHEADFNTIYKSAFVLSEAKPMSQTVHAVTSVNARGQYHSAAETPENFLQGKVPGLNMTRRSGTPGIGTFMSLRGYNSIYATNQPLVVVDGMIYDMNDYGGSLISGYFSNPLEHIDIKDVDNITVVKDATSTYGSKGANGAIFITTAHAQELATHIDFSASTGINFAPKSLPVMGASDYRIYVAEVLKSAGFSDTYIQSQPYMNDDPQALNYYRYHNNTNWQDKVLRNSITQNYSLRVTGGDNLAKLSLLIGHLDQKGIVNNTDFKRSSIRFNSDLNITPKLTATTHLSFSYSTHNLAEEGVSDKTNPVLLSLVKAPILHTNEMSDEGQVSPNLAGVDIFNISNPLQVTNKMIAQNTAYRFFGSANFKYQINDRFNVSSMFNITLAKISENFFVPSHGVVADTLYNALAKSRMGAQVQRTFATSTDTRIEYVKPLTSVHNVSARLGLRSIGNRSEEDFGLGYNSATDELQTIGTGVTVLRQTGGDLGKWTWINYYGAVDYSMFNKYFVSFNIAMDGSSRFGDEANGVSLYNNKFGVFPSVAAGWLISSENFMNDINMIEMLKLRASYGLTGNDDIGNYSAKRYYVSQNLIGMQGIILGNLANPALQWESVRKLNVGIDMALLNERLFFSVDVFRNVTDNMITYETVESITGIDKIVTNGGGMKNHGVELALNGRALDKEFKVDLGLNFSVYRNEVTELPSEMTTSYAGATILTRVGAPMGVFYGYETRGVFASSEEASAYSRLQANGTYAPFQGGDMRFVDRNGDFIIDEDDRTVIGDPNPDFTGSFSARVAWKRFVFDAAFTFSYGNDVYNSTRAQLESASGFENQTKAIVNRWRTEGQVTDVPRASWDDPSGNARFSDRWIEDGSYLRLRTVSLNYTLPYRKEITIYCSGNNLLTFSRYLGYDPEFSASNSALLQGIDAGMTPQYKSLLVGVRVGL